MGLGTTNIMKWYIPFGQMKQEPESGDEYHVYDMTFIRSCGSFMYRWNKSAIRDVLLRVQYRTEQIE